MKIFIIILGFIFLLTGGCSKKSTEPDPVPLESKISVSGDVTESYNVTAFFGVATSTVDTVVKQYFSIILFPNATGSNEFALTLLYKSGPENPETKTFTIGEYAFGQDIPPNSFAGSFSSINSEDMDGYTMTEGQLTVRTVSAAKITGEFSMSGFWRMGSEEDRDRVVNIIGSFTAVPVPEESTTHPYQNYSEHKIRDVRIER